MNREKLYKLIDFVATCSDEDLQLPFIKLAPDIRQLDLQDYQVVHLINGRQNSYRILPEAFNALSIETRRGIVLYLLNNLIITGGVIWMLAVAKENRSGLIEMFDPIDV